jgi:hyperosmotically inducible periplasmic protein
MSKFVRIVGIGAAAAAAMYLLDPDRGRSRRAQLSDQAAALARKAEENARAKAEYQKGVVQGLAHDLTGPFRPEPEFDDATLHQKVKSEAVGRWDGPKNDVEVDVDKGVVTLKGNVDAENVDDLIRLVEGVPGVASINDQLSVPHRS